MKRISCPKCGSYITFDEKAYPANRILVFVCASCGKQIKIRCNSTAKKAVGEQTFGELIILENAFHHKQIFPLHMGENVVGRYVKGTKANVPIETADPSMDTTHCIISVKKNKNDKLCFVLRDAPSNTGTFYKDVILKDADRILLEDGGIITIGATSIIFNEHPNSDETNPVSDSKK